jgi:hypothetical protein
MRTRIFLMLLAAAFARVELRAVILDQIAVTVGKQVITESDVIREIRVAAFLDQKPVNLDGDEKRKAADRLVDQILILRDAAISRAALAAPEEVQRMLDQVKSQYPSEADYQAALVRYRISEADVTGHLLAGLRALRFTDLRFRPEVEISSDDLQEFYANLATQWRARGETKIPTFDESRDQVEKLLTDERVGQALDRWLGAQRTQTPIVYRSQVFP